MRKCVQKNKEYILAFCIPLLILIMAYFCLGFLYSDGKTIFVSDMDGQYKALFVFYKEHFLSTYSFSNGIGGSIFGTFAYYLMSPLNLLSFLFSNENMYIAILLIITIKLCLSGLFMYVYLYHRYKKKKWLLLFSTSYVFIGYNIAYIFHIMWLDSVMLLPLIILGIEFIIKKKSSILYTVSLIIAIFCNYYIGYMICIFSVLYFIYRLFLEFNWKTNKKEIIDRCKLFFIVSLLSGLSLSFLLFPTINEFKYMPKSDINIFKREPLRLEMNPLLFLSKWFIGSHNDHNILSYYNFHIYIGILMFILVILYFLNPKITKREKCLSFIIIVIFLVSMFVNYIDYIWHGFNLPICFYGRYTFMFSFFLLTLATESFIHIDGNVKEHYFIVSLLFPIIGILVFLGNFDFIKNYLIYVSVFLSFLYLVFLYQIFYKKQSISLAYPLLFLLVCSELGMNLFFSIHDYKFRTISETREDYLNTNKYIQKIKSKDLDPFYRMEKGYSYSAIDPIYFNYNGIGTFLSTVEKKQLVFLGNMGYNVHDNVIEYQKTQPVSDSLLGIKYFFEKQTELAPYKKIDEFEISTVGYQYHNFFKSKVTVYENEYALPLGILTQKDISKCKLRIKDHDRLDYQNQIVSCLVGKNTSIYEKIPLEKKSDQEYLLKNTDNKTIYLYPNIRSDYLSDSEKVDLSINHINLGTYSNNAFAIQEFSNHAKIGSYLKIQIKNHKENKNIYKPYAYYYNHDAFKDTFTNLKEHSLKISNYKNGYIKGTFSVTRDNHYLFTTIPARDGWNVYIDGKKVNYDTVFDIFIGLDVNEGDHMIEFKYKVPYLKVGVLISLLSFTSLVLYIRKKK